MSKDYSDILRALVEAAGAGGAAAERVLPRAERAVTKGSGDFALTADLDSQSAILERLAHLLPGVPAIAEEDAVHGELPDAFITVDPLDGTIIGSRGRNEWGVLVSFVERAHARAAALLQPKRNSLISASHNGGAFQSRADGTEKRRIVFSSALPDAKRTVLTFELNYCTQPRHVEKLLLPLVQGGRLLVGRALGSAVSAVTELAEGAIDAYLNPAGGKIWDHAPGSLVVEEAGGCAYLLNPDSLAPEKFRCSTLEMGVMFFSNQAIAEDILPFLPV